MPLQGVLVIVDDRSTACVSDSAGFYDVNLEADREVHLDFMLTGYKTANYHLQVTDVTYLDVQLEPDLYFGQEVEVSARRQYSRATQIGTTISGNEMESLRGKNLASSLKTISGVSSLNTGNGISKPVIHGLHSNRIIILNNGIRQEGQQWGNEHGPEIDPFTADHLTILKGSGSLQYGPDALGGVILIEPQALRNDPGINGEAHILANSNGRGANVSAALEVCSKKIPGLSGRIQASGLRSGNVNSPDYYLSNTGQKDYHLSYAAAWRHRKWSSDIFYSQFNSQVGIFSGSHIGNLSDLMRAIERGIPADTSRFSYTLARPYQDIEHELLKVHSRWNISDSGFIDLTYGRQYNRRREFDKHVPLNDSLAALNRPSLELELTTHSADVLWEQRFRNQLTLNAAMNMSQQANTYSGMFFIPNYRQTAAGGFTGIRKKSGKNQYEAGLRYDWRHSEVFYYENQILLRPVLAFSNWAATMSYYRELNTYNSFTLQGGKAWRPPHVSELFSNGLHHGTASIERGNKNMREEISYQFNASFRHASTKFRMDATPYLMYAQDFIYLQPDQKAELTIRGAFPSFTYTQTDVILRGFDFTSSYDTDWNAQVKIQSSVLRAQQRANKEYLVMMPADKYQVTYTQRLKKKLSILAELVYTAKQWRISNARDYAPVPEAYTLFNCEVSYRPIRLHSNWSLSFGVQNILNTRYRDYMHRLRYFTLEQGRNFSIRISYSFNKNTQ